jgi:hypothetical protein
MIRPKEFSAMIQRRTDGHFAFGKRFFRFFQRPAHTGFIYKIHGFCLLSAMF